MASREIIMIIWIASAASVILPLSFAIIQWNKLRNELVLLRWLLIASLACDVLGYATSILFQNSVAVGNGFLLIQLLLLLWMFRMHHQNKMIVPVLAGIYLVFYIIDISFFEKFHELTTMATVVSSLIVITLSLNYLYRLLSELTITHIHRLPMLWIAFAVLLYYACSLFIILANNYLLKNHGDSQPMMWMVHNFFNVTKNILFAIALWKNYQKSST